MEVQIYPPYRESSSYDTSAGRPGIELDTEAHAAMSTTKTRAKQGAKLTPGSIRDPVLGILYHISFLHQRHASTRDIGIKM